MKMTLTMWLSFRGTVVCLSVKLTVVHSNGTGYKGKPNNITNPALPTKICKIVTSMLTSAV